MYHRKIILLLLLCSPTAFSQSRVNLAKHACETRKAVHAYFLAQSLEQTSLSLEGQLPSQASTLTRRTLDEFQEKLGELNDRLDLAITSFKNYSTLELQLSYAAADVAILRSTLTRLRSAIVASGISTQTLNPLLSSAGQSLEQIFQLLTEGHSLSECPSGIIP